MEERERYILAKLEEEGKVRVSALSEELGCSEVTIRKDIQGLARKHLLVRTHGGALPLEKKSEHKYEAESIYRNRKQKEAIGACAYEYIQDNETILIDDASTSFYLAEHIKNHPEKQLAVITNSLLVGIELANLSHIQLFLVGGQIGGNLAATLGETAVKNLEHVHVDKAFIGVHGINFDVGITSIGSPQMQVKQAILECAENVFVLADSSKFGGGYLQVICPLRRIYKVITDGGVKGEYVRLAEEQGLSMVIAERAETKRQER